MPRYDPLTPEERSERMSRVRVADTKPEMLVRKLLTSMGYRYRLHRATLPGKPDIVFPSRRKIIFVHGCFWHFHSPCRQYRFPRTRQRFWREKLESNKERDARNRRELKRLGWQSLVIWECQIKRASQLETRLRRYLEG